MTILLWCLACALIVAGIAGNVLPAVPGIPLVFLGLLLGAWIDHFQKVSGWSVGILAALTVLALGVDIVGTAIGMKRVDASREALVGSVIGALLGLFAGVPGLILGPFVGAVIGEFIARRDLYRAGRVGAASWLGMVFAAAIKLAVSVAMVGIFAAAYLFWK
jgi:uncharacterized protein YqgC (DUF456 family)